MRVGVTGHQNLPGGRSRHWVQEATKAQLSVDDLIGVTSLAVGADQMFAEIVLDLGGKLWAVLPMSGYERRLDALSRARFKRFVSLASTVETLSPMGTDEEAYLAAGRRVVDLSDLVVAIWDGRPARGLGGTADIVEYAQQTKTPTIWIDPLERMITRISSGVAQT
jgi:hypothetical protein